MSWSWEEKQAEHSSLSSSKYQAFKLSVWSHHSCGADLIHQQVPTDHPQRWCSRGWAGVLMDLQWHHLRLKTPALLSSESEASFVFEKKHLHFFIDLAVTLCICVHQQEQIKPHSSWGEGRSTRDTTQSKRGIWCIRWIFVWKLLFVLLFCFCLEVAE